MSTPAIFEKRQNMGASPLAIEYAEHILHEGKNPSAITVAALIDAAIRKSAAPELLTLLQRFHDATYGFENTSRLASLDFEQARAAIAKAKGEA